MILFLFVISLIAFTVLGLLLYFIYLPFKIYLKRKGKLNPASSRKINIIYSCSLLLAVVCFTLYEAYPPESFYEEEFKTVTLRDIPESAEFISKEASYPDFHGDYCSSARIQFSQKDYLKLSNEIENDPAVIVNEQDFSFAEQQQVPKHRLLKSFDRKIEGEEDHHLNIQFYDNNTVVINICVT